MTFDIQFCKIQDENLSNLAKICAKMESIISYLDSYNDLRNI